MQPLLEATVAFPAEPVGDRELAWGWVEAYADAGEMDPERVAAWTVLIARAQACAYDARASSNQEELAWAVGLHRLANALAR